MAPAVCAERGAIARRNTHNRLIAVRKVRMKETSNYDDQRQPAVTCKNSPGKFATLILNGIVGVCDSATRIHPGPVSRHWRLSHRTLSIDQRAPQPRIS